MRFFLHSLEFENVHNLSVAGGREEHAVHAEGQGADAHIPLSSSLELSFYPSGMENTLITKASAAKGLS